MASYPWEVVRNSNSGEKSFLKIEGAPKLKFASWTQLEVARKMAAASGRTSTGSWAMPGPGFSSGSILRLKAHIVSKIRPFESTNVIAV